MKTTITEQILIGALALVLLITLGAYFRESFKTAVHNFEQPNDGGVQ